MACQHGWEKYREFSPSDEELHAINDCQVLEKQPFPRAELPDGLPISMEVPETRLHTNKAKGAQQVLFTNVYIQIYK